MSGGVDSSVTAALLKDMGYEVVGVTMRLSDHANADKAVADAKQVADQLGIPHHELDLRAIFLQKVMEPFAKTYLEGKTPSPCAVCNRHIKFGALLDFAKELGCVSMATGHYARRVDGPHGVELHRGHDPRRDQSYFLFGLSAEQIGFLAFPLGDIEKTETRKLAEAYGLAVAQKSDSQDICFVPQGNYVPVVEQISGETPDVGDIVDLDGNVLGQHDGVLRYTIGQRRGLGISSPEPIYVIRLEPELKRVVVGPPSALIGHSCRIEDVNWLGHEPFDGKTIEAKLRSSSPSVEVTLKDLGDGFAHVVFAGPFSAIAPGQACVFYVDDRMLGGGWICRPDANV